MFRIVAKGEVELDAEVTETRMATPSRSASRRASRLPALGEIAGTVRLVSPEVDKATRLGRVRIFLGDNPGAAGRRLRARQPSRPAAAAASPCRPRPSSTDRTGPPCRWCATNRVETRRIKTGLAAGALTEVREGLQRGRPGRGALRHLPARRRRRAPGAERPHQAERRTLTRRGHELEHLRLVDPPAGAVAGAVHGADGARLCELRPAARHALSQYRRADRAGARLSVGRGAVRARGAGHQEDRGRHCRRQRRQAPDLGGHRGLVGDDHRVPPGDQPGPRPQRRQGRHRPHPRRAAAHHRRADRHAHRDRGPADRHLLGAARRA